MAFVWWVRGPLANEFGFCRDEDLADHVELGNCVVAKEFSAHQLPYGDRSQPLRYNHRMLTAEERNAMQPNPRPPETPPQQPPPDDEDEPQKRNRKRA